MRTSHGKLGAQKSSNINIFIYLFGLFRVDLNSVLDLNLYNEHGNSR